MLGDHVAVGDRNRQRKAATGPAVIDADDGSAFWEELVRHRLCLVFPLLSWTRHCLSFAVLQRAMLGKSVLTTIKELNKCNGDRVRTNLNKVKNTHDLPRVAQISALSRFLMAHRRSIVGVCFSSTRR